jgi:hypothetical protein
MRPFQAVMILSSSMGGSRGGPDLAQAREAAFGQRGRVPGGKGAEVRDGEPGAFAGRLVVVVAVVGDLEEVGEGRAVIRA